MIARALMPVDQDRGLSILDRALHEGRAGADGVAASFRTGSRGEETDYVGATPEAFVEVIGSGSVREAFSLAVPGAEADLTQLLIENHGRLRCLHSKAETVEGAAVRG